MRAAAVYFGSPVVKVAEIGPNQSDCRKFGAKRLSTNQIVAFLICISKMAAHDDVTGKNRKNWFFYAQIRKLKVKM